MHLMKATRKMALYGATHQITRFGPQDKHSGNPERGDAGNTKLRDKTCYQKEPSNILGHFTELMP
jgi:hypothetical protein